MEVAVERPPVVKEERMADAKQDMVATIGSALPIVFESFQQSGSMKPEGGGSRLEAARAEMGEVREENERLKAALSRIVSDYKSLKMHFLDVVKVHDEKLPAEPKAPAPVAADDDLVFLSLGTRGGANGGAGRKGGHERSASSGSGSGTAETTADDDSHLSLGLGFTRAGSSLAPSAADDDKASAGPVLNLSSDSNSSADGDAAKPAANQAAAPGESSRKSPSGGAGDDEVQQQAKKARVSVRVKCDTPTMPDGCQWRKYGQKISKGNPCPRAYYRCTVAPNCPVRKQVQRCAEDKSILITTYEGAHNHNLPPAATAMASTTSAAASMLTAGSSSSAPLLASRHHLPPGLLGPTTMVSTAASCPTITLDLTAPPHSSSSLMMHASSSPYAAGYESKALPAAWTSGYPAAYGPSYYGKSSPAMGLFGGGLTGLSRPAPEQQLFGGGHSPPSYLLQRSDTLAKALAADPSFQSVLATMITSYMGRGGGEAAQK